MDSGGVEVPEIKRTGRGGPQTILTLNEMGKHHRFGTITNLNIIVCL